jgi:dolichol-phosphate mannosyltransferase
MQPLRALIVLPTYQEAENIAEVLRRVRAAAPRADVLVIDDSSPDGTADIARAMDLELGGVSVICRPAKLGLGSAYREGFRLGRELGYEALVEMDSDLSHEPSDVPRLLGSLDAGADLVIGSRYVPGGSIPDWPWHRRTLSSYGNLYAAFMLRLRVRDATAGFRAYRADVLGRIDIGSVRTEGYGFQVEMTHRVMGAGGTIVEVPIQFVDRRRGTSKMSARIVIEALILVTWWGLKKRLPGRHPDLRTAPDPSN